MIIALLLHLDLASSDAIKHRHKDASIQVRDMNTKHTNIKYGVEWCDCCKREDEKWKKEKNSAEKKMKKKWITHDWILLVLFRLIEGISKLKIWLNLLKGYE